MAAGLSPEGSAPWLLPAFSDTLQYTWAAWAQPHGLSSGRGSWGGNAADIIRQGEPDIRLWEATRIHWLALHVPGPVRTPAPPKAEAKAKALKAKKAVLKGVHSHKKKKIRTSPTFRRPKTLRLRRQPKYPRKSAPRRNNPEAGCGGSRL
ncbi:60S ribosomal protein L23a isoform X3 [Trachypithecus francoisi]|uniref:60S ribosomal protein L23a isoform X3 n=1 Tax=Trachypithecus francoisi TaxID=54180 RepID=UPI00141B99B3|nr:60S ribosomal protein L23a isoform X3 [Trachypithecus francoisi]